MTENPLISVIVPIYNSENTISRCINSILSQSFKDFELLLVDDGSSDSSVTICESFCAIDKRVHIFKKQNEGVSAARNYGIDHAIGKWLAFTDSDDWVGNNYLESFIEQIQDGVDLYVEGVNILEGLNYTHTSTIRYKPRIIGREEALNELFSQRLSGVIWNKLFCMDIVKQHGICFNKEIRLREDDDFTINYLSHINKVSFLDICSYYYVQPDWKKKYKINTFNVNKILVNRILEFPGQLDDELIAKFLNAFANSTIDSFFIREDSVSRLHSFRILVSGKHKLLTKRNRLLVFFPERIVALLLQVYSSFYRTI